VHAAYFVVQVLLVKRTTSIAWQVEAMPLIARGPDDFEPFAKRSYIVRFHERDRLVSLFLDVLAGDASEFFTRVRAGWFALGRSEAANRPRDNGPHARRRDRLVSGNVAPPSTKRP
jgi:hypothetical protein